MEQGGEKSIRRESAFMKSLSFAHAVHGLVKLSCGAQFQETSESRGGAEPRRVPSAMTLIAMCLLACGFLL